MLTGVMSVAGGLLGGSLGGRMGAAIGAGIGTATGLGVSSKSHDKCRLTRELYYNTIPKSAFEQCFYHVF